MATTFADARDALLHGDDGPALRHARRLLQGAARTPASAAEAWELLSAAPRPSGALLAVRARAAWHAGSLTSAHADAVASLRARDIVATRRLVRSIQGEQQVLRPGWLPRLPSTGDGARRRPPVRGRVLQLVSTSLPISSSGSAIRTHEAARAQRSVGLDVHVSTPPGVPGRGHVVPATDVIDGVTYHRLAPGAERSADASARITRMAGAFLALAQALRPAVIHAAENAGMSETTAQAALAVGRALGVPVVLEVRGFREEAWLGRHGGDRSAERYDLTRASDGSTWAAADAIVTLGEAMRAEIVARGVPAPRVHLVPNAVDPDRFMPGPRDRDLARSLGIDDGVVIGYAGSLAWYEDLAALARVVGQLRAAGRQVRLLIVGDGDAAQEIRDAGAASGLGDALIMAGRVPYGRVVAYERLIDIFVVTRRDLRLARLVTPIKPLEGLAVGAAVVVNDLPALTELVVDGSTGRVVPAGDERALAAVLGELVDDPGQRQRLGHAGAAWVRSERTWVANGSRYRSLYESLGAA
jgi:glycosyltransferase involved in cell wall biosynthesis